MDAFAIIEMGVKHSRLGCYLPAAEGVELSSDTVDPGYLSDPEALAFPMALDSDSNWCLGAKAQAYQLESPERVVMSLELGHGLEGLGRSPRDPAAMWPFARPEVPADLRGERWRVASKHYRRAFLWAQFFAAGRLRVQEQAGRLVQALVIIIGPEWGLQMRRDAIEGAKAAGFNEVKLIDRAWATFVAGECEGGGDGRDPWSVFRDRPALLSGLAPAEERGQLSPAAAQDEGELHSVLNAAQLAVDETLSILRSESPADPSSPPPKDAAVSGAEAAAEAERSPSSLSQLEFADGSKGQAESQKQGQTQSQAQEDSTLGEGDAAADTEKEAEDAAKSSEKPSDEPLAEADPLADASPEQAAATDLHLLIYALEGALDMVLLDAKAPEVIRFRKVYPGLGEAAWNGRFVPAAAEGIAAPAKDPKARLEDDDIAKVRLWDLSAKVRRRLDLRAEVELHLPYLWAEKPWSTHFRWTRRKYEQLVEGELASWRSDLGEMLESLKERGQALASVNLCGPFCATPVFQRNILKLRDAGLMAKSCPFIKIEDPGASRGAARLWAQGAAVDANPDSISDPASGPASGPDESHLFSLSFCHHLELEHEDGVLLIDAEPWREPSQPREYALPIIDVAREGKAQCWRVWECWSDGASSDRRFAGEIRVTGHVQLHQIALILDIDPQGEYHFTLSKDALESGAGVEHRLPLTMEPLLGQTLRCDQAQVDYRLQVAWQREALRAHIQGQALALREEALQGHKIDDLIRNRIRSWLERVHSDTYFIKSDQRDGDEALDGELRALVQELQGVYEQLTPAHHKSLGLVSYEDAAPIPEPPKLSPEERFPFYLVADSEEEGQIEVREAEVKASVPPPEASPA